MMERRRERGQDRWTLATLRPIERRWREGRRKGGKDREVEKRGRASVGCREGVDKGLSEWRKKTEG